MAKTVLMVDDQPSIRRLVEMYLVQEGFRVVTATNGREALFLARQEKPDLIILDLMMPEMDGYEFMRAHRKERETPVIVLTARIEENDRVLGLELGADDYVIKPFSPRELAARVRAVLRRLDRQPGGLALLRGGDIVLDQETRRISVGGHQVDLTPTEFELLAILMREPGRAFSRWKLLERLQGGAVEGYERTIDVHIRNLRTKIEADPRQPHYIETVYGVGYRFAES
ncbi:MAG: response regulator transcription factor [Ardenticatenaceae bacterium]|nr:response regulator transcription factor [Ardenticatenaceae bacterium]HBY95426.1 DNA-binding response regulator [Chloroflexota bacterium]